ncbi:Vta1 like-domain-containing protein [Dipodascopsis uninucleata]
MSVSTPPASLKFIQPFILRANEVEKADPVISYYCKYYAIEEALAAKVHQRDSEAAEYVTRLLDLVEQDKEKLKDNDTIADEVVAQAYVEKFASKVFENADKDIAKKTVTRRTAIAFLAASNFFELLKLFGEVDKAIIDQIKYCKFHATRILKSISAGEDPNAYEPPTPVTGDEFGAVDVQLPVISDESQDRKPMDNVTLGAPSSSPPVIDQSSIISPAPSAPPSIAPTFQPSAPPTTITSRTPTPLVGSQFAHHVTKAEIENIVSEAERLSGAQKHARYAISALNYEDIETAVTELKTALKLLGQNV